MLNRTQKYLIHCIFPILMIFGNTDLYSQYCEQVSFSRAKFESRTDYARVAIKWHQEWLDAHNGQQVYPEAVEELDKWKHPHLSHLYPSSMHEESYNSDVSNFPGPIPANAEVQYFHVLEKGRAFSGMIPSYNFLSDDTLVVLSFGRAETHLLLLYVGDSIRQLDQVEVPGREYGALSLVTKKQRMALFRNTVGGAYSYLSKDRYMHIPGANNDIIRVPVGHGKFLLDQVEIINVSEQIGRGDFIDKHMTKREKSNVLTAIMPDDDGNIWFTSQHGLVGIIHHSDKAELGCPKIYFEFMGMFGALEKMNYYFGTSFKLKDDLPDFMLEYEEMTPEFRKKFRDTFVEDKTVSEQIQNSFAVGKDGVYIVSNLALYKLRFNEETKEIEMDPKWEENFAQGGLVYNNDGTRKPGHLNNGSGTSVTLMDDRFVAVTDNDTSQVNLCIFSQETGELVNKFPLFEHDKSAVENSIIAYNNTFIVGNTFNFVDPFEVNETPGGLERFDFNLATGKFERCKNWPPYPDPYDAKIATPKLSTPRGLVYVYNRDTDGGPTEHDDWQLTALDFETGMQVFSIKPYFNENEFNDNVSGLMKGLSLGKDNYDRKVLNNLMGTFSFGPNNRLYIGAYRGFIRFGSD